MMVGGCNWKCGWGGGGWVLAAAVAGRPCAWQSDALHSYSRLCSAADALASVCFRPVSTQKKAYHNKDAKQTCRHKYAPARPKTPMQDMMEMQMVQQANDLVRAAAQDISSVS